jgi:hypothetical protein
MDPSLDATAQLLQKLLLYAFLPVWVVAGFGDWLMHRWQRIEHTAGWRESALHLLMVAEMGIAATAVLLLEVTAAVFVLLLIAALLHEFTVWTDLNYAAARRRIPVPEQWVHSIQIVLPWAGLAILAVIHRGQAAAVIGLGGATADWSFRMKEPPLPVTEVAIAVAAALLLVVVPFVLELVRCLRSARAEHAQPPDRDGVRRAPSPRRTIGAA